MVYSGRHRPGESGITTREIILLVAMVVFLVVVLFSVFMKNKSVGSSAVALNNLVQWGIGLNLYLIDHENRLPIVGPSQPDGELKDAWYNALPPYLSQAPYTKLMEPSFNRQDASAIIWSDPVLEKMFGPTREALIFPYAMNRYLQPVPGSLSYSIVDLQAPGSVIFLGESASTDPGLLPSAVSYRYDRNPESPSARSHVLFIDGHAAAVTRSVLSAEQATAVGEEMPAVSWMPFPGAPAPVVD